MLSPDSGVAHLVPDFDEVADGCPPRKWPCEDSLDPVQVTQMAKYLDTVYVSGWQCSSTASSTNEPGPDLAGKFRIPFSSPAFALARAAV